MIYLLAGIAVFFGSHLYTSFRTREPGKGLQAKLGAGPYRGLYSLVAVIGFALIVYGYAETRGMGNVWYPPVWTRHLNILLQLFAFIILFAAYTPLGFIKRSLKHPMLAGVKLWAAGHLIANGEINSIILFGSFLAYAVLARIVLKRRGDTGPAPDARVTITGDILAVMLGTGFWLLMLFGLHGVLFGVPLMAFIS